MDKDRIKSLDGFFLFLFLSTIIVNITKRNYITRMAGLAVAPNCGLHLVEVEEYNQPKGYTPFNFIVKDVTEIRNKLIEKNVEVSDLRQGEPVRFDMFDFNKSVAA